LLNIRIARSATRWIEDQGPYNFKTDLALIPVNLPHIGDDHRSWSQLGGIDTGVCGLPIWRDPSMLAGTSRPAGKILQGNLNHLIGTGIDKA
jgi:hypothetical protein